MTSHSPSGPLKKGSIATRRLTWRSRLSALLYGVAFFMMTTATLAVQWPLANRYALEVGDVSPVDIRAPRYIEYISESLTEEARAEAERRVQAVYEPQRRARSEQVRRSQEVLDYIETVRADTFASEEEKLAYLRAIADVQLSDEDWRRVLALSDEAWQRVKKQVPTALNAIMLGEIRDNQLAAAKRKVPTYIDLVADDEAQAAIVLVQALLRPNAFYNAERTQAAREEARAAVPPQIATYEQNEIIIRAGDVVTQRHLETLEALGLNQPSWSWWQLGRAAILALVFSLIFGLYIVGGPSLRLLEQRQLGLLTALLAAFLLLTKLMVPGHIVLPYIFPLAALTMLLNPLLGLSVTYLVSIYFVVVVAYLTDGSLPLVIYSLAGPVAGALVLGRAERTSNFVTAGAVVALVNLAILGLFNLPPGEHDLAGYVQLAAAGLVNGGLAASITLIGFYLLGTIFDIATPLRLMELARPNHPLLRELLLKTPGTYHHSLLVSNLAEQAAEAIGADAFLTRVGAYYHDVGKLTRPYFYVENLLEGASNPHQQLDPWSSAQIIMGHVKDGLALARRYKLPKRIQDFISEHHGTTLVRYFYNEAQKLAGEGQTVDEKDFRYPGPKPQSKETAILMLADNCEGAVRAAHPDSQEELDNIVRRIINQRLIEGELADSDLTLRDLEQIRRVFVRMLQGVHHPRIRYPESRAQVQEAEARDGRQPEPTTVS